MLLTCAMVMSLTVSTMATDYNAFHYTIGSSDVEIYENLTAAQILNELGLLRGTDRGFDLEKAVTRAEAITMIVRITGCEAEAMLDSRGSGFSDVADGAHWAFPYVGYGKRNGIIDDTDTFRPSDPITGAEFAKMLLLAMGYENVTLDNVYDVGMKSDLLLNNYIKLAVDTQGYNLKRNDMVEMCCAALFAKTADGRILKDQLIEKGVFTQEEFDGLTIVECIDERSFAWKLNEKMPKDVNYMFSPFSIKVALAMAANGAEGQTREEIINTLGIDDLNSYNEAILEVIKAYNSSEDLKINVANSIWLNSDYYKGYDVDFSQEYKDLIADFYEGVAGKVENQNAVKTINDWISDKTNGRIDDVIKDPKFLASLINTVYFKGEWKSKFSPQNTKKADFTDANGEVKAIDFMNQTSYFDYFENEFMQMVRLPYKGDEFSMYIVLSDDANANFDSYVDEMSRMYVDVRVPKFKTEFEIKLKEVLKSSGIARAFSNTAQFAPMFVNNPEPIKIDEVVHKSFIEVDEGGTEAAAVTQIGMVRATSFIPAEPVVFEANRPFTYFIRHDTTGELLFIGTFSFAQ